MTIKYHKTVTKPQKCHLKSKKTLKCDTKRKT